MLLGGTDQVAHAVRSTWDSDLPCDPAVDHGRIGPETTGSHPQQLDLSRFIPPCHPPPSSPVAHFLQRMAALAVDLRCEPRNTRNTRKNACLDVQVVVHDRETAGTRRGAGSTPSIVCSRWSNPSPLRNTRSGKCCSSNELHSRPRLDFEPLASRIHQLANPSRPSRSVPTRQLSSK
jgi:hypothetical protein